MPGSIVICVHRRLTDQQPSCGERGSLRIAEALLESAKHCPVHVLTVHCFGRCHEGPVARIHGAFYCRLTEQDVPRLLESAEGK